MTSVNRHSETSPEKHPRASRRQGKVVDEMGRPLGGARIGLVGTPFVAVADANGAFVFDDCDDETPRCSGLSPCLEVSAEAHLTGMFSLDEARGKNWTFDLWSYALPRTGAQCDVTPWAYNYRKDAPFNPPETAWLWVNQDIVQDGPIWRLKKYEFVERLLPKERVLHGMLWEEQRQLHSLNVAFSGSDIPDPEDVVVLRGNKGSLWAPDPMGVLYLGIKAGSAESGRFVYDFCIPHQSNKFTAQKICIVNRGRRTDMCLPSVRAFAVARWKEPIAIEIEWGFQQDVPPACFGGRVEVYNGVIERVSPLEDGNGTVVLGKQHWREEAIPGRRRGVKVTLIPNDGPTDSRTIVTLWTDSACVSFAARDLDQGPILIPSVGVFAALGGSGISARQFRDHVRATGRKTIRERVRERSEHSLADAMRTFHGEAKPLPPFPTPPFEPAMRIQVPDDQINGQWRVGAWHLLRLAEKVDGTTYCPNIFRRNYEMTYCGGGAGIGTESHQIIRTLDLMGMHDYAAYCLNYWLDGEHALPFVWHAEAMGHGALVNAYNSPNRLSPGYDQKHSGGHGQILRAVALHCRLAEDKAWYDRIESVLENACQAVLNVRNDWMKELPEGCWAYGLLPPAVCSDLNDMRLFYFISAVWYSGLREAALVMAERGSSTGANLAREADCCLKTLRNAAERTATLTPVVKVGDGTYRRYISYQPYMRSTGIEMSLGAGAGWAECVFGGLTLAPAVFGRSETIVQEMLDVHEDLILPEVGRANPQNAEAMKTEHGWFLRSGQGAHGGHEAQHLLHLLNDDIPLYLRSVFNCFAVTVDPDNGYVCWEGPFWQCGIEKPFEEAAFLERIRNMLVIEDDGILWLARATPRAWLEQGKKISVKNAPTYFGPVAYQIVSDVDNGKIDATVDLPSRNPPKTVLLRLRHPKVAPVKSVTVNGKDWKDFNVERETIELKGLTGTVAVKVQY